MRAAVRFFFFASSLILLVGCCSVKIANVPELPPGRALEVGGHQLFVRQTGAGPDVVMLHGLGDSSIGWQFIEPTLVQAGYRVTIWDALGAGRSEKPAKGDYSIEAHVKRLAETLDALGNGAGEMGKVRFVSRGFPGFLFRIYPDCNTRAWWQDHGIGNVCEPSFTPNLFPPQPWSSSSTIGICIVCFCWSGWRLFCMAKPVSGKPLSLRQYVYENHSWHRG